MATTFGKALVFLNLFAAVGLFAWAISLYTNRPEWVSRTDGEIKIEGQIDRMKAEVDRLSKAIKDTQFAYARAADASVRQEGERDRRRAVLDGWMREVKDTNNPNAVFKQIPRLASGLINVGRPAEALRLPDFLGLQGKPLSGLGRLSTDLRNLIREEKDAKAQIAAARTTLNDLADKSKVVETEVFAQKLIRNNLVDQEAFLSDAQINWDETLRTLRVREKQLDARLAEVKGGKPAGGGSGGN